ncbi:branched-chain amino acid ABC transporter permease [Mycolicibacterium mageritense DSM 44476 = CIP 104973]|uniref:Branched-chain amino acid ABC transporter permease n=1 Tax=Mycolicibacterium mageritense TaxID=53462 RepID=A0AAI8TVQ5_MYCME|nr:branched-chain amino acid ABC transporter permease [Mycolicibacterium mageritense]MCC9179224.1 branched-chain amino acid ABC transporter permease [Mycolicibacterium mageritense]TXI63077.1 MAG: branched-chain amino acid ABC transporter permease [Mycolicibacterium mageritense]CDO26632.1 branched-chain amino acid ABC transporter permease [Mycolicibacterium mageritense DSM 44476 = CIP 104973]BBX37003.1 branched-chain amino acid ABC transporter permease [Mycolicibacterium mageritense]BDY31848.1 
MSEDDQQQREGRKSPLTTAFLAPGDGIRDLWATLPRAAKWVVGIPLFVLLGLLPLYTPDILDTPGVSFGGTMAQFAMVAIIAIGLNVVVGQAGLLDLGYVGFYAVGAYTVALLTSPTSPLNQAGPGGILGTKWAWLACVPLAMAITALAGLVLGIPTLRLRGDYLAIVTLGFGEIIRLVADNLAEVTNGPRGLSEVAYPRFREAQEPPNGVFSHGNAFGDTNYGTWWFWLGLVLIVVILLLVGNLERSRVGRAWIAIREDEDAAEVMGVNTFRFKLWAFVIGAAIGGLSGALYSGQVQFVAPPTFNIINSMLFLCAVVLGGQGNKLGVIFGAFVIVYLPNRLLGVEVAGINLGDLKYLFFGLALVVLMIFRPQGLFPARQYLLTYGRKARQFLRNPPVHEEVAR